MAARTKKNIFRDLYKINVDEYVLMKKGGKFQPKYISWCDAWALLKHDHPDATWKPYESPASGMPYFVSPDGCGVMVKVGVTVNDVEMICWQPIMDNNMNGKKVQAVTSRDVSDTIQRALVKAIGLHGLGLELWSKNEKQIRKHMNTEPIEPVKLESVQPPKMLSAQHPSWEKDKARFFGIMNRLNKSYDDLVALLEIEGKPRPSQMDQKTRNSCVGWLEKLDPNYLAIRS